MESFIVKPAALMIWGGNSLQKFVRRAQIQLALDYLTQEIKILRKTKGDSGEFSPSDGQIEAKGNKIDWSKYICELERLILDLEKRPIHYPNLLVAYLLFRLGLNCVINGKGENTIRIWQKIPAENLYNWFGETFVYAAIKVYPGGGSLIHHAIEQKQQSSSLYLVVGLVLVIFDHVEKAEVVYRQIIAKNPNDAYAQTQLGDVLRELKRYSEAEDAYRQAIASDSNYANAYSRLGGLLRKLERYTEAEDAYRESIDKDPNDAFAYFRFGTLLRILERYTEAEKTYHQAIDKDINRVYLPDIYLSLGSILRKQGRYTEALVAYKKAIELESSDPNIYKKLVHFLRFEESDKAEEALPFLES